MSLNISEAEPDVVLIGAGIMSATLGAMLKQLQPDWSIQIYERLDEVAAESSDAWNNAGTGHAALCELNYTPQLPDGSVEHVKAIAINESFELSKQFWMYMLKKDYLPAPSQFINPVPHMSFVWGAENVSYLKKRFDALTSHYFFNGMEYSEDPEVIAKWAPLIMEGRDKSEKIAATKIDTGTDVNFGALTRSLIKYLGTAGVPLNLGYEVKDITRTTDKRWQVTMTTNTGSKKTVTAKFIFIGAGGGALHLLQKTGIPEAKGFGGFPVGGQWLRCTNEAIINRHNAKVYGKASVGAPPMSVPHLDSRVIDGKKSLLFGPYAGFSTKFLKKGSYLDLLTSINLGNIGPMLAVGRDNMDLTKYLISEVLKSPAGKLKSLQEYFPEAKQEDWKLEIAGQRVQVIKKDEKKGGILQFGTEVVTAADGSISALLGASPGASTTVAIMLTLIKKCFPDKVSGVWQSKLKEMIPSYGQSLAKEKILYEKLNTEANLILGIVKTKSGVTV